MAHCLEHKVSLTEKATRKPGKTVELTSAQEYCAAGFERKCSEGGGALVSTPRPHKQFSGELVLVTGS
jgi:hypothetical protein